MQDFKVSLVSNWRLSLYNLDKIPYKVSIGFKSGDLVGQSKSSIFFYFKPVFRELRSLYGCVVLLKMALLVSRRFINGKRLFSNTLIYRAEFCFPSITTKSAFPDVKKAPQTIIHPPPNSPFENSCFSFLKSCQLHWELSGPSKLNFFSSENTTVSHFPLPMQWNW